MKRVASIAILAILAAFPVTIHAMEKEAGSAAKLSIVATQSDTESKRDPRILKIRQFFAQNDSPLTPYAETFVREADKNNLDWRLVAAIAGLESTFGKYVPSSSNNAWGWGVFDGRSYGAVFPSWDEGIHVVSQGIKERYVNDGLVTVDQIGTRYASSPTWAPRIKLLMDKITATEGKEQELADLSVTL